MILKSLLAWLAILVLAVANGALREAVLIPFLGKFSGLVISGILLSVLVALVAYALVHVMRGVTARQGVVIGAAWLLLTLAFEFSFGHYVQHKPWSELLQAYAFRDGNIWPVVLLVTLLAPSAAASLYARRRRTRI